MSRISVDKFIGGLYSVCSQKPVFKNGHDGSDGSCDGIGFIRGGLLRGGATKITNMKEVNQFARKTAQNIRKNDSNVSVGDVLLKTKEQDDSSMPLPSKYRIGGSEYTGDLTNYVDVCVVIKENPVELLHMTKEGLVKEKDLSSWDYVCSLPYIEEEEKAMSSAMLFADGGDSVKTYAKPSFSCQDIILMPNGTPVMVSESNGAWSTISYGDKVMYVLSKNVKPAEAKKSVNGIDMKEIEKAYMILGKVLGYVK